MPGCLGLDALWQLTGFFLGWLGLPGRGRALGVGEVRFEDQVLPSVRRFVYGVDSKAGIQRKVKSCGLRRMAGSRWSAHIWRFEYARWAVWYGRARSLARFGGLWLVSEEEIV